MAPDPNELRIDGRVHKLLIASLLIEASLQEVVKALAAQQVVSPRLIESMRELRETLNSLSGNFTGTEL